MRFVLFSVFFGLAIGVTGFWVPSNWLQILEASEPEQTAIDPASFKSLLKFELNHERSVNGQAGLQTDIKIERWIRGKLEQAKENTPDAIDAILQSLQDSNPTVHAAAAYLSYATTEEALLKQVIEWHREVGGEATHVSTFPFVDSNRLGCFTVSIRKLPVFTPRLLDEEVDLFYNTCVLCKKPHAGRVPPSKRSVVFACPHCSRPFDAFAMDNGGRYRRVTNFLSRFKAPVFEPQPESRLEEMYCVWYAVATRCRYTQDIVGTDGPSDYWQESTQTFNLKNGDCEDSSILLADWLIDRGIQARVATGKTSDGEGHAWCVAQVDGAQYLLETTTLPDPENPPYVSGMKGEYQPRYLFDRKNIYFLRQGIDAKEVTDYWVPDLWEVAAPRSQGQSEPKDGNLANLGRAAEPTELLSKGNVGP